MLMSAYHAAVDRDLPVDASLGLFARVQRREDPLPGAISLPAHEAIVAGLVRTVASWQIRPRRSRAQHPADAVDHGAVALPLPAALPLARGQKRLELLPLLIRQVSACHFSSYCSGYVRPSWHAETIPAFVRYALVADDEDPIKWEAQAIAGVEGVEEPEDSFEIW
jgi:hypothetical protein